MNLSVRLLLRVCSHGWAGPRESPDDGCRWSCLHRRRADDPPDSSRRRGWSDGVPSSAYGRPCRWKRSRDRCCRPDPPSPCNPPAPCGFRRRAVSAGRSRLLWRPVRPRPLLNAPSARPCPASARRCAPSCRGGCCAAAEHCLPGCRRRDR